MRLRYRVLLFLPISIFIGAVCVFIYSSPSTSPNYVHHYAVRGVNDVREHIEFRLEIAETENVQISLETIDQWLQDEIGSNHPAYRCLLDTPEPDIWGNPYRLRIEPESTVNDLLVYSTGHDGISKSDGNDPDDIRLWDENIGVWYERRIMFRIILYCTTIGFLWSPIFLVFLLWITQPKKPLRQGGYNKALDRSR